MSILVTAICTVMWERARGCEFCPLRPLQHVVRPQVRKMASNILTVPNLLTCLRMALIPVFASLLFYGYSGWALFVFLIRLLTRRVPVR